jgi:hypothetical protein
MEKPRRPLRTVDLVRASGAARRTITKFADRGLIPSARDVNGWRVYPVRAVARVRELLGFGVLEDDEGVSR